MATTLECGSGDAVGDGAGAVAMVHRHVSLWRLTESRVRTQTRPGPPQALPRRIERWDFHSAGDAAKSRIFTYSRRSAGGGGVAGRYGECEHLPKPPRRCHRHPLDTTRSFHSNTQTTMAGPHAMQRQPAMSTRLLFLLASAPYLALNASSITVRASSPSRSKRHWNRQSFWCWWRPVGSTLSRGVLRQSGTRSSMM